MREIDMHGKKHTYADYLTWQTEERWELIDGSAFMGPAPSTAHQRCSMELARQIANFLIDKTGSVFTAPFDVRFPERAQADEEIMDVVQPDLCVICDPAKLDERGCLGAPDLIIEIVSPAGMERDHIVKKALYERNRVKEYWLVDPSAGTVTVFILEKEDRYGLPTLHTAPEKIESAAIIGLTVDLSLVLSFKG
jgi:Uma2 family endonuclease